MIVRSHKRERSEEIAAFDAWMEKIKNVHRTNNAAMYAAYKKVMPLKYQSF